MIRVHVICEGQTEEEFVRHLLAPALQEKQVYLVASCIGRVGHKGGNVNLGRLSTDLRERLLYDQQCVCTTFFDYYGLPSDFPGKTAGLMLNTIGDKQQQVFQALSQWALDHLGNQAASRFIPYVQMYEFEGLLFSNPSALAAALGCIRSEQDFAAIRSGFTTPEWINDSPHSAPSKGISMLFPAYDKPEHPLFAALDIGLDSIRRECLLFDAWVKRLEGLNKGGEV